MIKWLMFFCISSPLIWAPNFAPKSVYRHMKDSGFATDIVRFLSPEADESSDTVATYH